MTTKEQKLLIDRVITTFKWRMDVDRGEMIEQRINGMQYCKDHLSHSGGVSQKDLDSICDIVSDLFFKCGSDLTVDNSMGEIIPTTRLQI